MTQHPSNDEFPRGMSDREFLLGPQVEPAASNSPPPVLAPVTRLRLLGQLLTFIGGMAVVLSAVNLSDSIANYRDPSLLEKRIPDLKKIFPDDEVFAEAIDQMVAWNETPFFICYAAVCVGISIVILIGGWRVRQQRSYSLCIVSAVLVMLPVNLTCCVGIPVGIWALVVLLNDDIRKSFRS
ncbi:MAG: hypothetical protein Aurels2KO_09490 [Aureliella sp.]